MIPAAFEYVRAGSVDEAVSLLAQHGDEAKLLAGGHSLLPLMKLRLATPGVLVDVGRLRDLSYVRDAGDHIAIGALTRHRDLEISPVLAKDCQILARSRPWSATRRCATGARSAARCRTATRRPTSRRRWWRSTPPSWRRGRAAPPGRSRPTDFFHGFLDTALGETEMLTEIQVPKAAAGHYLKFNRRAQDWAIVGAFVANSGGATKVALTNMGSTPVRARAVEQALASGASTTDAAAHAADDTDPPSDLNASPEYRQHLARVLTRQRARGRRLTVPVEDPVPAAGTSPGCARCAVRPTRTRSCCQVRITPCSCSVPCPRRRRRPGASRPPWPWAPTTACTEHTRCACATCARSPTTGAWPPAW